MYLSSGERRGADVNTVLESIRLSCRSTSMSSGFGGENAAGSIGIPVRNYLA
jgi:hypothetical protein